MLQKQQAELSKLIENVEKKCPNPCTCAPATGSDPFQSRVVCGAGCPCRPGACQMNCHPHLAFNSGRECGNGMRRDQMQTLVQMTIDRKSVDAKMKLEKKKLQVMKIQQAASYGRQHQHSSPAAGSKQVVKKGIGRRGGRSSRLSSPLPPRDTASMETAADAGPAPDTAAAPLPASTDSPAAAPLAAPPAARGRRTPQIELDVDEPDKGGEEEKVLDFSSVLQYDGKVRKHSQSQSSKAGNVMGV